MIEPIIPDWPAPDHVRAYSTTRQGGVSQGAWASLNLATHVDDDPINVSENRRRVSEALVIPNEPSLCLLRHLLRPLRLLHLVLLLHLRSAAHHKLTG